MCESKVHLRSGAVSQYFQFFQFFFMTMVLKLARVGPYQTKPPLHLFIRIDLPILILQLKLPPHLGPPHPFGLFRYPFSLDSFFLIPKVKDHSRATGEKDDAGRNGKWLVCTISQYAAEVILSHSSRLTPPARERGSELRSALLFFSSRRMVVEERPRDGRWLCIKHWNLGARSGVIEVFTCLADERKALGQRKGKDIAICNVLGMWRIKYAILDLEKFPETASALFHLLKYR